MAICSHRTARRRFIRVNVGRELYPSKELFEWQPDYNSLSERDYSIMVSPRVSYRTTVPHRYSLGRSRHSRAISYHQDELAFILFRPWNTLGITTHLRPTVQIWINFFYIATGVCSRLIKGQRQRSVEHFTPRVDSRALKQMCKLHVCHLSTCNSMPCNTTTCYIINLIHPDTYFFTTYIRHLPFQMPILAKNRQNDGIF